MRLPITPDNLREWFPAPATENPLAGDPWWQLQSIGCLMAMQFMRLIPDGDVRQQALVELRRSIDTGLLAIPTPSDEEITRRMAQTLAPYCPSPFPVVKAMVDLAGLTRRGETVYDLGCGDGRVLFEVAQRISILPGLNRAIGLDIDAQFIAACLERQHERPFRSEIEFYQANVLETEFSDATVVFCYLLSQSMVTLEQKFRQLRPGARIISHAFDIPGWVPTARETVGDSTVFLWVV